MNVHIIAWHKQFFWAVLNFQIAKFFGRTLEGPKNDFHKCIGHHWVLLTRSIMMASKTFTMYTELQESVPTAVKSFLMKLVLSTVWIIKHQKSGQDKIYQHSKSPL